MDWYGWGPEAFDLAQKEDRPVFLSVGYSACHWCHVMAHESFEDAGTAAELNARFVSIKVDREERPDVDAVYMEAVQAMAGRGGWPMSVFLTPDGRPFFGGTYFPPTDAHGTPSFRRVLNALSEAWTERRPEVERQADAMAEAVVRQSVLPTSVRPIGPGGFRVDGDDEVDGEDAGGSDAHLGHGLLDAAATELAGRFDAAWGGFGHAPKFPQPTVLDLVLRHARRTGSAASLQMATTTLDAMAAGGIYDHLGGGFARYSTDGTWLVPHFEKMLYDQAGLVRAYLYGWLITGRDDYRQVVEETVGYVLRDLASPGGGLCSAEDADSEGVEGRFYVWTLAELDDVLGSGDAGDAGGCDADAAAAWYGVTAEGNWEDRTILRRPLGATLARPEQIEASRRLLFDARNKRIRPGLDGKVLTEWNAFFASALAEAAAATGRQDWADRAVGVAEFLLAELRRPDDGRWLRSWQAGKARHLAYAADYAWLVDCFTRLGELTGRAAWTQRAIETADALLDLFWDAEDGGFFTTGHDAETLLVRSKDVFDGALPSANSVAAHALTRLGALTGDERFVDAARSVIVRLGGLLAGHPVAFAGSTIVADMVHHGLDEIVVVGDRSDLVEAVQTRWLPETVLAWGEPTGSPLWKDRRSGWAYVCRRYACQAPVDGVTELVAGLEKVG